MEDQDFVTRLHIKISIGCWW